MMKFLLTVIFLLNSALLAGPIRIYLNEAGVKVLTNLGTSRFPASPAEQSENASPNFARLVNHFAQRYGIDENLVKAIIRVESNYDPQAVSPKGCMGLMQLHPDTARRFGVANIFDPSQNIHGGVRYLDFLMKYFEGDLERVLAAYNAGENAVERHGGIPPYRETRDYVKKVQSFYRRSLRAETPAQRENRRIYRITQPDGGLLLTNLPASSAGN